jgi:hypothetical protein
MFKNGSEVEVANIAEAELLRNFINRLILINHSLFDLTEPGCLYITRSGQL